MAFIFTIVLNTKLIIIKHLGKNVSYIIIYNYIKYIYNILKYILKYIYIIFFRD